MKSGGELGTCETSLGASYQRPSRATAGPELGNAESEKAVAVVGTMKSCLGGFSSLGKSLGLIFPICAIGRG